MIHNICKY